MDEALRRRLEQCENLPSPPAVAVRILALADAPATTMSDIGDAVSLDPALAAKVLRIANSPLYGQRRTSDNIREAIVLLGLSTTMTLALGFSLFTCLRGRQTEGLDADAYWRRSLLTASLSRILAREFSGAPTEDSFLAGLLQDLGMLALDWAEPATYSGISTDTQLDHSALVRFERASVGTCHADAGAWLLQHWGLPEPLIDAVRLSHADHIEAGDYLNGALAQTVNVAAICADIFIPGACPGATAQAQLRAMEYWDVTEDWLESVSADMEQCIPEIESAFDISLFKAGELQTLRDRARDLLVEQNLGTLQELEQARHTPILDNSDNVGEHDELVLSTLPRGQTI